MAAFPEGNPGVAPLDPTSDVGRFRLLYGDTEYEAYDPPEPGMGNYDALSDAEIEGYIAAGEDSVTRGIGYYYLALAGRAAKESKSIADYDLRLDTTKRAGDLRAIAEMWMARADEEDETSGAGAYFDVVPTGTSHRHRDELAEGRWC